MREILSENRTQELLSLILKLKNEKLIKSGYNEVIKTINKGKVHLVVLANDSTPKCLTDCLITLCENKGVNYVYVESKEALGKACKIETSTIACCIYERKEREVEKYISKINSIIK